MKKILSIILSAISAMLGIFLVSCDSTREPQKSYAYYGIVQTLEGFEGLYVNVPDFGVCQLPTYEEGKNPNLALKEGDLISMDFGSEIQVTKSYPAIIATPARYVSVCKKDIEFKTTNEKYLLTIDYTEEIKNELLGYDKKVGDFVYFWASEGVPMDSAPGTAGSRMRVFDYATATIEMLSETRLTLSLSLEQDMQEFFKYYASGRLEFKGEKIVGDEEDVFCNFFDVQSRLELTDFEKVEIITHFGSVSPENREPTQYITSEKQEDFENVYYWLKALNKANLNEITQSESFVEGGTSKVLTVYTKQGNFKIYQAAGSILTIWDRYFAMLGEKMPEIVGDSTVYKFDYSFDKKVGFYKWNQFASEYNFKISELSFIKINCDYTLPRIGYFLKTDVGVIELYSNKIFYHEGSDCYYEIVGEKDFSIIFDARPPQTEEEFINYYFIKAFYAQKYCKDNTCENVILEYYGEYKRYDNASGAIVALVSCSDMNYATYEWTETVAGHNFTYGDANRISVFYGGDVYTLETAYENGYLTETDIEEIARRRVIFKYFSLIK